MQNSAKLLWVSAILVMLSGPDGTVSRSWSSQQRQKVPPKPSQDPTAELAAVRDEIRGLRAQLAELQERLKRTEASAFRLQWGLSDLQNRNLSVSLDPAAPKKYQRLDSSSGFFLASLQNVEPYLDGFRITLNIGNLTSARYDGFKLSATWGPRYDWDKFTPETYKKWESQKQSKDFSYTDSLMPGTWNKADLILPTTTPSQVGFIQVSIDTDIVSLGGGQLR